MACVPAVGFGRVGYHLAGRLVMVEKRVSPAAGRREPLAVLLDEESLRGGVRHIHDEGGLRALLEVPLELRNLGALREGLAVARNAGFVRLDHGRIGDDDLEHFIGAGGGNHRPVLVSPEVGERDSARRDQLVLVVVRRENERPAQDSEYGDGDPHRELARALHGWSFLECCGRSTNNRGAGSFSIFTTSETASWTETLVASNAPAAAPNSVLARMFTSFSPIRYAERP